MYARVESVIALAVVEGEHRVLFSALPSAHIAYSLVVGYMHESNRLRGRVEPAARAQHGREDRL